ncbi:MAG: hypothetical protein Tsb002_23220 [Wenzhouxiangellaceae bacterium]
MTSKYRFKGASANYAGQVFPVEGEFWLGSDSACQVVVDEPGVAARHARVAVDQQGVVIKTASSAAIWINGAEVSEGRLNSGDELRLGSARLVFQAPGLRPTSVLREEPAKRFPWGWVIGAVAVAAAGVAAWYYLM